MDAHRDTGHREDRRADQRERHDQRAEEERLRGVGVGDQRVLDQIGMREERVEVLDQYEIDGSNRKTTYAYDPSDGLIKTTHDDTFSKDEYYGDGTLKAYTNERGKTTNCSYDPLGHLTAATDPLGRVTSSIYDPMGELVQKVLPGGSCSTSPYTGCETLTYDRAGGLPSSNWADGLTTGTSNVVYDADHQRTSYKDASGTTTLTWDSLNRLTSVKVATTLANFAYTRDGMDYVATATTTGITDPAQTNTYNSREQLVTSGATSAPTAYTYDADGNMTRRRSSSLAYDDVRLQRGQRAHLLQRLRDLRLQRWRPADVQDDLRDEDVVHLGRRPGPAPALLSDGTNNYIYGHDGHLLEQITSSGTVTYVHHDQIGSTRLLTSTTGTNVGTYNYDAYGGSVTHTGTVSAQIQFAGEYADNESGLIYPRARYYDPAAAQFVSVDPAIELEKVDGKWERQGSRPPDPDDPMDELMAASDDIPVDVKVTITTVIVP
ncbi:RHS repeat-associated core domain-containing protein [Baekduia sp. Peel2402]|uniref:RHS repeat-associated core domain-containing protein n=1 Tax=Baekduia sp. Peel2402 TaxID=3458296 RepID=UPI00403EECA7